MSTVRLLNLGLGASVLGASMALIPWDHTLRLFWKYDVATWWLFLVMFLAGLFLTAHGTGFLQQLWLWVWRMRRRRAVVIGVINDAPWELLKQKIPSLPHPWVGKEWCPDKWQMRLRGLLSKKLKVELTTVSSRWAGWSLDRYKMIVNPYGSAYPERDVSKLPVFEDILGYVARGGVFVNVADLPFYYAYDISKDIRYDLTVPTPSYTPSGTINIYSFEASPFCHRTRTRMSITDKTFVLHSGNGKTQEVQMSRAAIVGDSNHVSVPEGWNLGQPTLAPIFCVQYGQGKFVVSSMFLDKDDNKSEGNCIFQQEAIVQKLTSIIEALAKG